VGIWNKFQQIALLVCFPLKEAPEKVLISFSIIAWRIIFKGPADFMSFHNCLLSCMQNEMFIKMFLAGLRLAFFNVVGMRLLRTVSHSFLFNVFCV
jgi:hypothetical protein